VRRLVLAPLLLVLPLAAACGGGGKEAAPATTGAAAPDPGKAALVALVRAAVRDDRKALWNLLSTESQKRLGGYDMFKAEGADALERALAPFARTEPTPFVSQSISAPFGIVAVRSGEKALAFPLRQEDGTWKVLAPGPLTFKVLAPAPGSKSAVSQIAVEVRSPGEVDDAVVWVDGRLIPPTLAPTQGRATVFASLARALAPGTHAAVVYAVDGNDASAEAWTFSASG
jgi:hypothetical protein